MRSKHENQNVFRSGKLVPCLLVCRKWSSGMKPLLWRVITPFLMFQRSPKPIPVRLPQPTDCLFDISEVSDWTPAYSVSLARLVELKLRHSHGFPCGLDLVRMNSGRNIDLELGRARKHCTTRHTESSGFVLSGGDPSSRRLAIN